MLTHSCGYYLANAGVDLRTMQDYLGHRDPQHAVHYTRVAALRGTIESEAVTRMSWVMIVWREISERLDNPWKRGAAVLISIPLIGLLASLSWAGYMYSIAYLEATSRSEFCFSWMAFDQGPDAAFRLLAERKANPSTEAVRKVEEGQRYQECIAAGYWPDARKALAEVGRWAWWSVAVASALAILWLLTVIGRWVLMR